jgi:hypothetical protein
MPYNATIYRVFIASPGDVPKERSIIRSTVVDWNSVHAASKRLFLDPVGWETHAVPTMGDRPQAIINKQILKDADLLIGVFWTRLGTATGEHASGTVEEIEEHIAAGKPAMIYFSDAPVRLDSVDEDQYSALKKFRKELQARGLIESYEDHAEFAQKLNRQLNQLVISQFSSSAESGSEPPEPASPRRQVDLNDDAIDLLSEAAKGDGVIGMIRHLGGMHIQVGDGVVDTSTPRLSAKWESAVGELYSRGYIRDRGHKGELFDVTEVGYKLVESLGLLNG